MAEKSSTWKINLPKPNTEAEPKRLATACAGWRANATRSTESDDGTINHYPVKYTALPKNDWRTWKNGDQIEYSPPASCRTHRLGQHWKLSSLIHLIDALFISARNIEIMYMSCSDAIPFQLDCTGSLALENMPNQVKCMGTVLKWNGHLRCHRCVQCASLIRNEALLEKGKLVR